MNHAQLNKFYPERIKKRWQFLMEDQDVTRMHNPEKWYRYNEAIGIPREYVDRMCKGDFWHLPDEVKLAVIQEYESVKEVIKELKEERENETPDAYDVMVKSIRDFDSGAWNGETCDAYDPEENCY